MKCRVRVHSLTTRVMRINYTASPVTHITHWNGFQFLMNAVFFFLTCRSHRSSTLTSNLFACSYSGYRFLSLSTQTHTHRPKTITLQGVLSALLRPPSCHVGKDKRPVTLLFPAGRHTFTQTDTAHAGRHAAFTSRADGLARVSVSE